MIDESGAGIHLLGSTRPPSNKGKDLITRDEAEEVARRATVEVCEFYLRQVPELVATYVESAMHAYAAADREAAVERVMAAIEADAKAAADACADATHTIDSRDMG